MFNVKIKGVRDTSLGSVDVYPILTGTELDFLCANQYKKTDGSTEYIMGINNGNCIGLAGISNTGKSTLALNIAGRGLRQYPKSSLIHFDTENGMTPDYMMRMLGIPKDKMEEKVMYINRSASTIETVTSVMEQVVKQKKENISDHYFDTGLVNKLTGKKIKGVQPTYVIIDSWMKLRSEKVRKEGYNLMTAATEAKNKGNMLETLKDDARELNIIIIIVTHSGEKIHTGYGSPKTEFQGLSNTTVVNGGKTLKYECELMLFADKYLQSRSDRIEEILKHNRVDYIVSWVLYKSRLSKAGRVLAMCKGDGEAFSMIDSMQYSMCKEYELIQGSRYDKKEFDLSAYSEEEKKELYQDKFNVAKFSQLMSTNKVFKATVFRLMMDYWKKVVLTDEKEKKDEIAIVEDVF